MQDFTPTEIATVCLFFGVAPDTALGNVLAEGYILESGQVRHPSGDILESHPHGIVVTVSASLHPWYFSRDFYGLVIALEKLTEEIA